MENVLEERQTKIEIEEKKHITLFGITLWRLFAYFIIYSVVGFVVETIFGLAKYGLLESRQSFLYGPFCSIYGIGAVIMIITLHYFKKSHLSLFVGGALVGTAIEYIVSLIGELLLHIKWWDYSDMPFNINGRVCLLYAVFWGILSLFLMISLNPRIDRMINYIKSKIRDDFLQILVVILTILMFLDFLLTAFALSYFTIRTIKEKKIEVNHQEYINKEYDRIYKNEKKTKIINTFFSNEKMLKTFPRLTLQNREGKIIFVKDLYPEIKTYYYKLHIEKSLTKGYV